MNLVNLAPFKSVDNNNQELWLTEEEVMYYFSINLSSFLHYYNY